MIDVGKLPGHHAVPQTEIERLMVERPWPAHRRAAQGGDPYVFGRGGEEVAAAVDAGVPSPSCRGCRRPSACPERPAYRSPIAASATSSRSSRGTCRSTTRPRAGLAELGGTVVVLMGMHNLVPIAAALERCGLDPDTPAAVVERGFTPDQRSLVGTLRTLPGLVERGGAASPPSS